MREQRDGSFFDDKHAVMEHGSAEPGVRRCCYADQASVIESIIPAGAMVVDVGCGPALPYRRAKAWTLIGVDLSYESLRANTEVDVAVYGSAADLPLADRSVDAIVSLYAIHHFGGQTRRENEGRVARGFSEFGRVLKPGGSLFIFELSPFRRVRFHAPTMTPIPPVFACPGLKIPRFLFPFDVHLYHWTV